MSFVKESINPVYLLSI